MKKAVPEHFMGYVRIQLFYYVNYYTILRMEAIFR